MARRHASLLIPHADGRWTVVTPDGTARTSGESIAGEAPSIRTSGLAELLTGAGWPGGPAVLGLSARRVHAATVATGNLPRRGRDQALLYRLEDQLPVEAEGLTADFLPAVGGRCLGVAVATDAVAEQLDELEAAGLKVEVICPVSLLALWAAARRRPLTDADFALVAEDDGVGAFRLAAGVPIAWYHVAPDPDPLVRTLNADLLNNPADAPSPRVRIVGAIPPAALSALAEAGFEPVADEVSPEPDALPLQPAAQAAAAAADGLSGGWINLRREALSPAGALGRLGRPLQVAVVLVLALLASLAAGTWWRAGQYHALADDQEARQAAIFREVYPNQAVPPNVRSRLDSEARRLAGVSGARVELPGQTDALADLGRLIDALPATMRLRVVNLRVEPALVQIEGQVRQHADAEIIARALADATGLEVEPPRTEHLVKGGVSFTLIARRPDPGDTATAGRSP